MKTAALLAVLGGLMMTPAGTPAFAQDRAACTAKCGGRAGGEGANSPKVVACFRKCMGTTGDSDSAGKRQR